MQKPPHKSVTIAFAGSVLLTAPMKSDDHRLVAQIITWSKQFQDSQRMNPNG